jgi:hypothetical protein
MTPKAAFDNIIDRAEAMLQLYDALRVTGGVSTVPTNRLNSAQDDLLRAALVQSVAALDRYVHDRITKSIVAAYRNRPLNKEQANFSIPVSIALKIANKVAAARASKTQIRPANVVRNAIQEVLHKRPFQSWNEIEKAFALIGITGLKGHIQRNRGLANLDAEIAHLSGLVRTRNLIVHEGHIRRHQRGGKATLLPITASEVRGGIQFLRALVNDLQTAQ